MKKLIMISILVLLSGIVNASERMNQSNMESIVKSAAQRSAGGGGVVEFVVNDVKMLLISDAKHDRMRIISAIIEYKDVTSGQRDAIMESNFHSSLDARYAVSKGILYAAYIHPLSELSAGQVKSAVEQVANLARSFGGEYSSGILSYGKQ